MSASMFATIARSHKSRVTITPAQSTCSAIPQSPPGNESVEERLKALLLAPTSHDETIAQGFARKETEIRELFRTLSTMESRAFYARFSNPHSGDPLAHAFMRLTADRRARLITFLADARRRAAISR